MRCAVVTGTRPEIVQLAPIVRQLGADAEVVYTGQHDDAPAASVFDASGMSRPKDVVPVAGRTRGEQIGHGVAGLSALWASNPPDVVVVQGHTNVALAGALAAHAVDRPLVHLEAGLRSFDRSMPEEHNRFLIDHLSDVLLAPTERSADNLRTEGISCGIEVVGTTIFEAVRACMPSPAERARLLSDGGLSANGFILATIHRRENTDTPEALAGILQQLGKLAVAFPVVFAVHPRTRARIDELGLDELLAGLRVVEPLDYRSFLGLSAEAALLVSDSSGVEAEVSVYKRPLVVVRRSTERPEVVGTFTRLASPDGVYDAAAAWLDDLGAHHRRLAELPCPYGEGDAARLAADAVRAVAN